MCSNINIDHIKAQGHKMSRTEETDKTSLIKHQLEANIRRDGDSENDRSLNSVEISGSFSRVGSECLVMDEILQQMFRENTRKNSCKVRCRIKIRRLNLI